MSSRKDLIILCRFRGHSIFRRMLKSPSRLTRLNALVRSMKAMYRGSVVPCISPGVGEGRKSCLLLSVVCRNRIGIQDRHVQLVTGGVCA